MGIVGVDSAVFGVEDVEAAQRFCRDYGFLEVEHGATGAAFEALDGTNVLLRRADDTSLPTAPVKGSTGRETVWGVSDKAALEQIGAELAKDRQVRRDAAGVLHTMDDEGLALGLPGDEAPRLQGRAEAVQRRGPAAAAADEQPRRLHARAATRARSGHIVFWSADPDKSMKFYTDRLGFKITDHVRKGGVFARAPGSHDHHNLFFILRPQATTSFQHLECHFGDFQEIVVNGGYISRQGWTTDRGPGRHVLGSNYYWYFRTPLGGQMELSADIDQIDDNWVPGEWEQLADVTGFMTSIVKGPEPIATDF